MLPQVARDLLRKQDTRRIGSHGIASGLGRPLLEEDFLLEQARQAEEAGERLHEKRPLYPPLDGEREVLRNEEGPAEQERVEALWLGVEKEAAVGAASVAKSEASRERQIEERRNLYPPLDPALITVKEVDIRLILTMTSHHTPAQHSSRPRRCPEPRSKSSGEQGGDEPNGATVAPHKLCPDARGSQFLPRGCSSQDQS